jgi:gliding motility-associated-like protein
MKKYIGLILLYCFIFNTAHSQLCTGSLGDPVVNITFGNYTTPRGPLKKGVTTLTYVTGCPNDGEYTLADLLFGCFNNSWHLLSRDHTGDVGRFMVVNASVEPSDFYVDTVSGLCGNTLYEFAAWAANVLLPTSCGGNGIKPNLTFRIETTTGTVLKKFDSGDIPATALTTWNQYGTFFTTPAGVGSVVLRITNNAKGGCGNDLMLDDITFRACGPRINAYISGNSNQSIEVCENNKNDFQFNASYSTGFTDPVLQWQISKDTGKTWVDIAGEQNNTYTRKVTGFGSFQYRVVIAERANFASSQCRLASNVTTITVNPMPVGPSYTEVTGCINKDIRMYAVEGSGFTYTWTGPNNFSSPISSPVISNVTNKDSGNYVTFINTPLGCTRRDTFNLKVYPGVTASVNANANVCEGSSIVLQASGGAVYNWFPVTALSDAHIANPVASPEDTVNYTVVVANQFGCKDTTHTTVNVWKKPVVNAGVDQRIFEGASTVLSGTVSGTSISFNWMPNVSIQNSNQLTPTVNPVDNTTYLLTGISDLGCGSATDDVIISVYKQIKIPNIFSPNGDGINDTWAIRDMDTYPDATIKVFNRGGQIVFEAKTGSKEWDGTYHGKPLPLATYYYIIDLNIGKPVLSGSIVLIR